MKQPDYIAVIDFGSQYAHLIARRVRQLNVLAKIFTPDTSATEYADAKGIILSGDQKVLLQPMPWLMIRRCLN